MVDPSASDVVIGGGALGTVAILGVRYLWRVISSDKVEMHSDRGRIDLLTVLQEENKLLRERCDIAFNERNLAMQETSALRNEVAMLMRDVSDLQMQLDILKQRVSGMPRVDNDG